jgi:hypothetical protein
MKLVKCSPDQANLQNLCSNLASSRSRSPVVFKGLSHVFRAFTGVFVTKPSAPALDKKLETLVTLC